MGSLVLHTAYSFAASLAQCWPCQEPQGKRSPGTVPNGQHGKRDIKVVSTHLRGLAPSRTPSRAHPTTQGCPVYAPSIALWKHHSGGLQHSHWHSYRHRGTAPGSMTCQAQCCTAWMRSEGAICPCNQRTALTPVLFYCLRPNQCFPEKGPLHNRVRCCMSSSSVTVM